MKSILVPANTYTEKSLQYAFKLAACTQAAIVTLPLLLPSEAEATEAWQEIESYSKRFQTQLLVLSSNLLPTLWTYSLPFQALLILPEESQFKAIQKIALVGEYERLQNYQVFDHFSQWLGIGRSEIHILNIHEDVDKDKNDFELDYHLKTSDNGYYFSSSHSIEQGVRNYLESSAIDLLILDFAEANKLKAFQKNLLLKSRVPILLLQMPQFSNDSPPKTGPAH